jgi:hypothetical protein
VRPFLPELVLAIFLVVEFVKVQLAEDELILTFDICIDAFPGSKGFKISNFLGKIFRAGNQVKMILHNDIRMESKTLASDEIPERVKDNNSNVRVAKKRQPVYGSGSQEIGRGIVW